MYDFSKIKFDTFWREPQNRVYLNDMYEPLPNAPKDVIDSYNRYKDQISQAKRNISKSIFKGLNCLYFFESYIKVKMEFITEGEMKMNKKDLIENIALNNPTLTKKSVDEIVNTIFDDMAEALSKGETVDIFGFGKFEVTERGERDGINPVTMEKIRIKASKNVKFRPSKSLKNKVN